jgi:hypothetical protein
MGGAHAFDTVLVFEFAGEPPQAVRAMHGMHMQTMPFDNPWSVVLNTIGKHCVNIEFMQIIAETYHHTEAVSVSVLITLIENVFANAGNRCAC